MASMRSPAPRQDSDHVRQVVLPLIVGGADLGQRRPQPARVEAVDAGVDLRDGLLVVGGVALLDDPGDAPGLSEDPPIAPRLIDDRGQHGGRGPGRAVVCHQAFDRGPGQERRVTGQHDDRPAPAQRLGLLERVAGAEAIALLHELHVGAEQMREIADVRADDHHEPIGHGTRYPERVRDERAPAEPVKHFGQAGAHPLALPRGKDDNRQLVHRISLDMGAPR